MNKKDSSILKRIVYVICGMLITVPHLAFSILATIMYMYGELTTTYMIALLGMWITWALGITGLAVLAFGTKNVSEGWKNSISSQS